MTEPSLFNTGQPMIMKDNKECDVHDEKPTPTGDTMRAIKLQAPRSDKTAKSVTDLLSDIEASDTSTKFILSVPSG